VWYINKITFNANYICHKKQNRCRC